MITARRSNGLPLRLPPAALPAEHAVAISLFSDGERNAVTKIFLVAATLLLPPALVASVYGMNITAMPALEWARAHPLSLVPMAVSAVVPFFFFGWKGWL